MMVATNEKSGYKGADHVTQPEATANNKCLFFLDIGRDASRQPVKHSVPHGKLL